MQELRIASSKLIRNIEFTLRCALIGVAIVGIAEPLIPEGQLPMGGPQAQSALGVPGDPDSVLTKRQLSMLNMQRQKKMVSEADKLLALARELNSEIETANSNSMSTDQMRKVEEIEKLAKSVKTRMTTTVGPA